MRLSASLLLAFFLAACHKDAPPPKAEAPAATAPTSAGIGAGGGIVAELQREASDRPKDTPSADRVLKTFADAGVAMQSTKQVLATALRAHYCEVASTTAGLGMSICEFDDADQAKAGRVRSETEFKAFGKRTMVVNAKTLLSLNPMVDNAKVEEEKEKVIALFTQLSVK